MLPTVLPAGQLAAARSAPPPARFLPKGRRDLARQVAIWLGFVLGYQVARGLADRGVAEAFRNARRVVRAEEHLGVLVERDVQQLVLPFGALVHALDWTYWLAQLAVVSGALLWIYLRRHGAYLWFRNTIVVANTIGLVGYVALPTAPPRMLPELGLVDTLAHAEPLNHGSAIVELVSNEYAAMPSLHAADALIVGVTLALLVRPWALRVLFLLWPAWVALALIATANHFVLDVAAGAALAVLAGVVTTAAMRDGAGEPAPIRAFPQPGPGRSRIRPAGR